MFAERFWSPGYGDGLETLFTKLKQGVVENSELLSLAQARADAEEAHGLRLQQIPEQLGPKKTGFARDDGATMRKTYEGILGQMNEEGSQHLHVAQSIRTMVVTPFTTWAAQHKTRIERCQTELRANVKHYERELGEVHRAQQRYFNRCRLEEDGGGEDAEDADANTTVESTGSGSSTSAGNTGDAISANGNTSGAEGTSEELVLGEHHYTAEESQALVASMLRDIPQKSTRVTILGLYEHTSSGADITQWIQEHTAATSLGDAEAAGQKLLQDGFFRLIGQVGSRFVNSSVFMYQWRHKAWQFAGLGSTVPQSSAHQLYSDLTSRWTAGRADPATQSIKELDQKYRKAVTILDNTRCELEQSMFKLLLYLESCERERLTAFKAAILDFAAAVSNVVPAISASVDKLLLFHETTDVSRDLRFLVESYQTGRYSPRVVVYDNYYSSVDGASVFGFDLDLRARGDKKRVPVVVSAALGAMDDAYPKMENDSVRLQVWQAPLSTELIAAQELRRSLNVGGQTGGQVRELLRDVEPIHVVQALKLYLVELPTSVVSGQFYDILRVIYAKYSDSEEMRLQALQNILAQLNISHIATLDAFTAHIKRLVTIANASSEDIDLLARELGPMLCRPKAASALSLDDVFPAQILKDLLGDRDRMFAELKRHAVLSPQSSVASHTSQRSRRDPRSRIASGRSGADSSRPGSPSLNSPSLVQPSRLRSSSQDSETPPAEPSSRFGSERAANKGHQTASSRTQNNHSANHHAAEHSASSSPPNTSLNGAQEPVNASEDALKASAESVRDTVPRAASSPPQASPDPDFRDAHEEAQ